MELVFKNTDIGEVRLKKSKVGFKEFTNEELNDSDFLFESNNWQLENIVPPQGKVFYEQQTVNIHFENKKDSQYKAPFTCYLNQLKLEDIQSSEKITYGSFRLHNSVGYSELLIKDKKNSTVFSLNFEIFPQKLKYKDDYKVMQDEITEIIYNLAFDYLKQSYTYASLKHSKIQSTVEWLAIYKAIFELIEISVDQIVMRMKTKIEISERIRTVDRVKKASKNTLKWVRTNQKYHQINGLGFQLTKNLAISHLPENKKHLTYDTFENRYVKWALKSIIAKSNQLEGIIVINKDAKSDIEFLRKTKRRFEYYLNDDKFKQISEFDHRMHFSTSLTMGSGYKEFYYRFLLLNKGLEINSNNELFRVDYKNISTLYEYWCFLKTIKILRQNPKYDLESTDFIKITNNKLIFKLQKGVESKVIFKNSANEKITISYNKKITSHRNSNFSDIPYSATNQQEPDNFIEFRKSAFPNTPFWFILDAKYRLYKNQKNDNYNDGPPIDAINQLHRYRDAILSARENQNETYNNVLKSLGGIILFPYQNINDEFFKEHVFFKSIEKVNIGAIPLHPNHSHKLYNEFLDKLLSKQGEDVFNSISDFDKTEYKKQFQYIHIGIIPQNDLVSRLKFIEQNNIYHIPISENENIPEHLLTNKYLLLKISDDKDYVLYKIEKYFVLTDTSLLRRGVSWNLRGKLYLVYQIQQVKKLFLNIDLNIRDYRYSNLWTLDIIEKESSIYKNINGWFNITHSMQYDFLKYLETKKIKYNLTRKRLIIRDNMDYSSINIEIEDKNKKIIIEHRPLEKPRFILINEDYYDTNKLIQKIETIF